MPRSQRPTTRLRQQRKWPKSITEASRALALCITQDASPVDTNHAKERLKAEFVRHGINCDAREENHGRKFPTLYNFDLAQDRMHDTFASAAKVIEKLAMPNVEAFVVATEDGQFLPVAELHRAEYAYAAALNERGLWVRKRGE